MSTRLIDKFEDLVSWYTIIVHDAQFNEPYNDWTRVHSQQGFAWRPGTVSFATLDITPTTIEVCLGAEAHLRPDAIRAIRVPFDVGRLGVNVVSTNSRALQVPTGNYSLTFEQGQENAGQRLWTVLTFVPDKHPAPAVLRADSELSPPPTLVMTAEPV